MSNMESYLEKLPRDSTLDDPEKEIIVVGYPKSGNTWLSRLLGSAIGCPVMGFKSALPLATEGLDRKSSYVVRQLHLKQRYHCKGDNFLVSAHGACIDNWKGEKVVLVVRDPRDVIVSVKHYWNIESINETIKAMYFATKPLDNMPYQQFVVDWSTVTIPTYTVLYERLKKRKEFELSNLIDRMAIPNIPWSRIEKAWSENDFDRTRNRIEMDGDDRPYGKSIQLKNLRKGSVGDWRYHFTRADAELTWECFGGLMIRLGYEKNNRWVDEVK